MNELEVIYEDNHVLVVYKQPGILSQEDHTKDLDLVNMAKKYLKEKYQKPGNVYVGLVHRLDRMTSGVLVLAKTSKAASRLSEQMKKGQFNKKYYVIVHGKTNDYGILENKLLKDEKKNKSFVTNSPNGKLASLEYRRLGTFSHKNDLFSLIDVKLNTGRHHQIRVQFNHINHPLYGDTKYGNDKVKSYEKFFLCAYSLEFIHPTTKQLMHFSIQPKDSIFQIAITKNK